MCLFPLMVPSFVLFLKKGSRLQQSWSELRMVTFAILWRCLNGAIVHRWRHKFQGSLHWWRWHYDSSYSESKQINKRTFQILNSIDCVFITCLFSFPINNLFCWFLQGIPQVWGFLEKLLNPWLQWRKREIQMCLWRWIKEADAKSISMFWCRRAKTIC